MNKVWNIGLCQITRWRARHGGSLPLSSSPDPVDLVRDPTCFQKDPFRSAAVRTARALPMSQPQPAICVPAMLACLLAISVTGCQSFGPNGYGAYPGNYSSYPVYQPGTVVPYNGPAGTVVSPGNGFAPQQGVYPSQGVPNSYPPGSYPPGSAPAFNPQYNPNYSLPQVNPNGGAGGGVQPGVSGAEIDTDAFGQPGQFPGATGTNSATQRPRMPAEEKFPVPNYNDPTQPDATTAPVNNTSRPNPRSNLGRESFQGEINPGKRAIQKLETIEEDPAVPTTVVPKKTSMLLNDADGATVDFVPPVNSEILHRSSRNVIQTAQHLEGGPVLRPYGRASNGEAWFRGIVDYDEEEKTWYLIYNPQPEEADERGGIVTLLEHPSLQFLQSDDTVLVEGHFDQLATDRYGNPKYQVGSVKRLVPPQSAGT